MPSVALAKEGILVRRSTLLRMARPFFIAGSGESAAGLISRLFSVQLGILLPIFSERSLEVRHSAWDRDHACANPAAPTIFYQVCGSVSGAPAREAGEAGAN